MDGLLGGDGLGWDLRYLKHELRMLEIAGWKIHALELRRAATTVLHDPSRPSQLHMLALRQSRIHAEDLSKRNPHPQGFGLGRRAQ